MPATMATLEKALKHHRAGCLCEARRLYWRILEREPQNADALHLLGVASHQLGRLDEAKSADEQAVQMLGALLKKDPISSDFQQELSQAQLEGARLQLARGNVMAAEGALRSAQTIIEKLRAKAPDDRGDLLLDAQAHLLLGEIAARTHDTATMHHEWRHASGLLQPALRAGDDPNFLAAYTEALLRLDQTEATQPIIAKLNAMGYRTPDFVVLLASKRVDYPVNAAFQQRLAQIMQGDAARP